MEAFDSQQMKRIIEKSLETEKQNSRASKGQSEYSVSDIMGIAKDLGVSEASVHQAIASEKAESKSYSKFFGGPTVIEERATGPDIADSDLRAFMRFLPELFGMQGYGNIDAGRLHWEVEQAVAARNNRNYSIQISHCEGKVQIIIRNKLIDAAGGIVGGTVGATAIASGAMGIPILSISPLFIPLFALVSLLPSYAISKKAYAFFLRRKRKQMHRLLQTILEQLSA